jgi:pSer/pThr/pTyr-binding forkhead associated (FHA) protein
MLNKISEKKAHNIRLFLTFGWLILIFSMFYDPYSAQLTDRISAFHPFYATLPNDCFQFQAETCREMSSYAMGARVFWAIIIPLVILTLIIFGHEAWRRSCPLSFMSQIPRALGIQRRRKVIDPVTKEKRYELVTISPDSWLGKNVLYVQFGFLFLGLNVRLLLANSDRFMLGIFLILTILAAIAIGYLYAGKTWCHYFCPMAPVQMIYTGPRSLLGSEAYHNESNVTQSMCRTIDPDGNEKSACVSCKSSCFDIDAERSYWDGINQRGRRFLYYGYVGLAIGFYVYFSLYSGNPNFLAGGVWNETNQLETLLQPGFYLDNQAIPIPKLLAVPLTLGLFTVSTYLIGIFLEHQYTKHHSHLSQIQIRHGAYTICTFLAFSFLFFLGVYPTIGWLTPIGQNLLSWIAVTAVSWWTYRTIFRDLEQFDRESTASSLRRQLNKLGIDFSKLLEGRSLENLKADEVYILAKTLPGLNRTRRLQIYKGALQESLAAGNVSSSRSLEVFQDMRTSMDINDQDHQKILLELGVSDQDLLNPEKQLSRENQLRLDSYRKGMEMLLIELIESGTPLQKALKLKQRQILALRQEYNISTAEESQVFAEMLNENSTLIGASESLFEQLRILRARERSLQPLVNLSQVDEKAVHLLTQGIQEKQKLVTTQLLSILEILGDSPEAIKIASSLPGLTTVLSIPDWQKRLSPDVFSYLNSAIAQHPISLPMGETQVGLTRLSLDAAIEVLTLLAQEIGPVKQAVSLYTLQQLEPQIATGLAESLLNSTDPLDDFVQETAKRILNDHSLSGIQIDTLLLRIEFDRYCEEKIFQQPIIRIGRGKDNDIVFLDKRISRYHAVLYLDDKGVRIQDLGGVNSIRIGNRMIKNQEVQLNQPAVLKFGNSEELSISVNWQKRDSQSSNLDTLNKLLGLFENKFFKSLDLDALLNLARYGVLRRYNQGEVILKVGEPVVEILAIVKGSIRAPELNQTFFVGESIGELEVLTNQPSISAYTAENETLAISIPIKEFEEMIEQDNQLVRKILYNISDRLQALLSSQIDHA